MRNTAYNRIENQRWFQEETITLPVLCPGCFKHHVARVTVDQAKVLLATGRRAFMGHAIVRLCDRCEFGERAQDGIGEGIKGKLQFVD